MAGDTGHGQRLRFAVLGPVRAWRGGEELRTGSPQQRALLAALLLRGGRTATAAELVDALWGDDPPHAALAALRTYASRLRKAFGPDADVLASEAGGYALRAGVGCLDIDTAERLAAEAEKARAAGNGTRARALITEALAVWDGEPLAHVPGPYADTQRARLEEWRLGLVETRLDLDLELGHHAEAVSELTALTAAHPLRERLRELLMLALYRSGRQAEALAVYTDTRRLLDDELGVEPCAELSELQQRILRGDADLAPHPSGDRAGSGLSFVRPAQLPATVPDFTGRDAFVQELSHQLATAEGRVMAVSAVAGIGGVGKTTLAVHVAHAAREHFPDGQLYVDLQGTGPVVAEPEAVLGAFLRALGVADSAIPEGLQERSALFRSTLDGRRVLALLDNARDAAQVRPLLPGTEGCAALVTSRTRMVDLAGAHLVDLDVMSPEEALVLFTRIVGTERVAAERDAAMDTVAACGFLPLAIRIAASRLAARRTWTVSVLARKLGDERRRLDELRAGDLAVKATFELGYGQLEPAQARAFRLLGLPDGPDISLPAAAAVLDLDVDTTEELLETLVDASLLESAAPGRYRFHDLLRLYARSCAERDEQPPAEREAAMSRLLDFYLSTAAGVYVLERPGDQLLKNITPTTHQGLTFTDRAAGADWLYAEAPCMLACVRQHAQDTGEPLRKAVDLLLATNDLTESGAYSRLYANAADDMLAAARRVGDSRAEGRARTVLANVHSLSGRFSQADQQAAEALRLARESGDILPRCIAANIRAIVAIYQQRYGDAETYCEQALASFRADGNRPGEVSALSNLSRVHGETGRSETAVRLAEQSLAIYRELQVSWRLANGHYAYGMALRAAQRHEDALAQFVEALSIFRQNRQRMWEGWSLARMAEAFHTLGDHARGAAHAEQALVRLRGIGGEWRRGGILTVLGHCLDRLGQRGRARACWAEALRTFEQLGNEGEAAEVRRLLEMAHT
ncbi:MULTISPECIES: AfsR/SARP family transcriptional regulator [Streptomyces]|uniref:AfsR/SARP family transcriptional regulator n=1 Tax=Streptomyces TaxID=1883 RepID=UPI00163BA7E0|nr:MULTISPECIES: BTAD domain-containing putative transcriptional regulator [Streptomyces]MBC2875971.1 tetratricopeptide repeat protein [Streptomyces sp. TYQ1024]UBI38339.1 tetratricopeptide repeat protein [Streptomyces mobaraensis]UKW30923.1 tetratricopeptide repeat protein [Streptomyces sp. TYQ1024]